MPAPDPHTVDVAVKGFTWSAAFSGATFVTILTGIGMLFKSGGVEAFKEWNRARKERRDEDRTEEVTLTQRLDALEVRASTAERRLGFVLTACTTLLAALEEVEPDNPALRQARTQLAMASGKLANEDPFGDMLVRLGQIPPVDRSTPQ